MVELSLERVEDLETPYQYIFAGNVGDLLKVRGSGESDPTYLDPKIAKPAIAEFLGSEALTTDRMAWFRINRAPAQQQRLGYAGVLGSVDDHLQGRIIEASLANDDPHAQVTQDSLGDRPLDDWGIAVCAYMLNGKGLDLGFPRQRDGGAEASLPTTYLAVSVFLLFTDDVVANMTRYESRPGDLQKSVPRTVFEDIRTQLGMTNDFVPVGGSNESQWKRYHSGMKSYAVPLRLDKGAGLDEFVHAQHHLVPAMQAIAGLPVVKRARRIKAVYRRMKEQIDALGVEGLGDAGIPGPELRDHDPVRFAVQQLDYELSRNVAAMQAGARGRLGALPVKYQTEMSRAIRALTITPETKLSEDHVRALRLL